MRWLVVGANGMLGQDMVAALDGAGYPATAIDRETIDITDPASVDGVLGRGDFDVVVNCAAWTAVDDAEEHEGAAFAVNATGAGLLARSAHRIGARIVQISTDYVFGGDATTPYAEDDPVAPKGAYGRTKLAGEWAVRSEHPDSLVVRTAWLYGAHGACFPRTIARLLSERPGVSVVDDQVGQPTWTADLADLVIRLVDAAVPAGIYHGTSSGATSWFAFAQAVAESTGRPAARVQPTTSVASARPAPRPAYSVLGHGALQGLGVAPIGNWEGRWAIAAESVLSDV